MTTRSFVCVASMLLLALSACSSGEQSAADLRIEELGGLGNLSIEGGWSSDADLRRLDAVVVGEVTEAEIFASELQVNAPEEGTDHRRRLDFEVDEVLAGDLAPGDVLEIRDEWGFRETPDGARHISGYGASVLEVGDRVLVGLRRADGSDGAPYVVGPSDGVLFLHDGDVVDTARFGIVERFETMSEDELIAEVRSILGG